MIELEKVELWNSKGDRLITTVGVVPNSNKPRIIMWNDRAFALSFQYLKYIEVTWVLGQNGKEN